MTRKAPGKHYRTGISLVGLMDKFPNDRAAEDWFTKNRWPHGVRCPSCNSDNIYTRPEEKRRNQPYRCRSCRTDYSGKTGTLMESSKVGYRKWVIAIYLLTTNLKGVSSMKLHRDLGISQKTAWMLMHKVRETFDDDSPALFDGTVEVDETYIGGKERESNKVSASPIANISADTIHQIIRENVDYDAKLYTDSATAYESVPQDHESVNHTIGEYVRKQAHTNRIESFWALLKRGYYGTYHRMSEKHLARYVNEFAGRHNIRSKENITQMNIIASNMVGKRLRYGDLISDNLK